MHMIFYIKMDGKFTRKARLVSDAHTTAPPSSLTYSIAVSTEIIKVSFILAYLNYLDIFANDIVWSRA